MTLKFRNLKMKGYMRHTITPDLTVTFNTVQEQDRLVPSDIAASMTFGEECTISFDGDTVIASTAGGPVHVFTRSGTTWSEQDELISGVSNDNIGISIDISNDGNTAIVGAYGEDTPSSSAGAVYIFTRSGSVWTQQQKLLASDGAGSDFFGYRVAISPDGKIAIIGAREEDSGRGAVYVFTESGSVWTEKQKVVSSNAAVDDEFSISLDISDEGTIAVGSWFENVDGTDAGGVYIFVE